MRPVRQQTFGGVRSAFYRLVLSCVLLCLMGLVGYLLADIHHRRYRLVTRHQQLIVERGLFLPLGWAPYRPSRLGAAAQGRPLGAEPQLAPHAGALPADLLAATASLEEIYAPVDLPPDEAAFSSGTLEERAEVDRCLFDLLSSWAQPRLQSRDLAQVAQGIAYVRRLEILPGLSDKQRGVLRQLRAHVAFVNGNATVAALSQQLRRAQQDYHQAVELGSPRATEARRMIAEIDLRLQQIEGLSSLQQPQAPTLPGQAPAPTAATAAPAGSHTKR
jgi:hypothetical protein